MPGCSVPYCANATGKETGLTFHPFPHETPLFLKKWLENIGRPNWRPGHRSVVCCEHFEKDDFDRQGRLRIGSFPVKFPEPPFRKKTKLDTSADAADKSLKVSMKQVSLLKPTAGVLLPVVKQPPSITKKDSAEGNEPSQQLTSVEKVSSPVEILSECGPDTDPHINVSNENSIQMKQDQNISSVTKSPEVSLKRKVLEESQPTAHVDSRTIGVASSYSLRACRICGAAHASNVSIFGKEGKDLSLSELLKKCHIQVSESGSLPHYVCRQCIPRLKTTHELMTTWEKTNGIKKMKNVEEPDPPVIHSKPLLPSQHASRGNRRVLLLEMGLREGIPVKDMIAQAIQELTLRLKPKESRESKPEGRIMFLDLQGGTDAFPEQMKKAISMLFPCVPKITPVTKKILPTLAPRPTVPPLSSVSTPATDLQRVQANAADPSKSGVSSASTVKPVVNLKAAVTNATTTSTSSKQVAQAKATVSTPLVVKQPVQAKVALKALSSPAAAASSTSILKPLAMVPMGSASSPNLLVQTSPEFSSIPLTIMASTPGTSPAIRIASAGGLPQLIHIPPVNNLNTQSNPSTVDKNTTVELSDSDDDAHIYEDGPLEFGSSTQSESSTVPPLVPIKQVPTKVPIPKEKSTNSSTSGTPVISISKLRDSVVSKMNNMTNQIKLGDKIVGIVLRDSDSQSDIHKKLQATFSAKGPSSKDNRPKERPILPKGGVTIVGVEGTSSGGVEGGKKLKPKVLDVPSAVDSPTDYSDRRNARRLSLSYMWRKTGFLVSSYQKLFTWTLGTDEDAMPALTCRVCKFIPKSKHEVESHLTSHPDLQCPICSKYFLKDTKVFEHMTVIHGTQLPSSFVSKKKPPILWRVNSVKKPCRQYQCSRCDRRFKLKESLKRHATVCNRIGSGYERPMGAVAPNTCAVCSRTFPSEEAMEEHALTHVKRTSWLCDICGLVLKSSSNYRTHIARHDELAHEYQYQCNTCKKRFKLLNRYQDHMKKHETVQQFICSSCGKTFNTLSGLRQHEILHGERKLQCKFCPHRFHRRDHLRIHESSHLKPKPARTADGRAIPGTGRMFTCRFCVATKNDVVRFPNMRELMKHYSDDHSYERGSIPASKKFDCDRCNKSFVNSTLLRHHHMWHAGLRPYNCSICGAGFMIKERLRNHEMTHTNERPYKCQVCGKGFRSRNVLKQHKLIHKDPSEFYKCKYCDKSFSRIDNLRTHTRVHTGEKPWKCLHCDRQFRLRSECTKHIQIAHQVPPEEVGASIETLMDPLSAVSSSEAQTAIAAIAGITTVQDMELVIEDDDDIEDDDVLEECDEDSLQ